MVEASGAVAPRPRGHVRPACQTCRRRKVRCDARAGGGGFTCTPCESAGIQCIVDINGDRRKRGSRDHVAALQERLDSVEALLKRSLQREERLALSSRETEASSLHESSTGRGSQGSTAVSTTLTTPSSNPPRILGDMIGDDNANTLTDLPPLLTGFSGIKDMRGRPTHAPEDNDRRSDHLYNHISDLSTSSSDHGFGTPFDPSNPSEVPAFEFPARVNSPRDQHVQSLDVDASCGQLRFLGPTSQLHVSSPSEGTDEASVDGTEIPNLTVNIDSTQLRMKLLRSYWKLQSLSVNVMHPETFMTHLAAGTRSQYFSVFLYHAVLACAARLSTSGAVRALGYKYAKNAKMEIALELESPNLASLQGFLLLSDFELTRGRERIGWMYCGIACRLLYDLGLQEDCSEMVKQGKLTSFEASFRGKLSLSCFVYERLWSLYLGRPGAISMSSLELVREFAKEEDTLDAWVGLCGLMSEMTDILNSPSPVRAQALDRLSELDLQLRAWYDALPPALTYDENAIADLDVTAYSLHMQYCQMQIMAHRIPSTACCRKRKFGYSDSNFNLLHGYTLESSRNIVLKSAIRIASLLLTYRQIHGVEKVPSAFLDNLYIAATVFVSYILKPPAQQQPTEQDIQWLLLLLDTLETLQKHYPYTARMRRTLLCILEHSSVAALFGLSKGATPGEIAERASATEISPSRSFEGVMGDFMLDNLEYIDLDGSLGGTDQGWIHISQPNMMQRPYGSSWF